MIKEMQTLKRKCLRAFVRFKQSAFARKGTLALVALTLAAGDVMAGSKGAAGFTKATQEVSIAAVIVLVGAFNVYFKMQNGDQDVKKTIMLTIGGCIAFIALSEALPLFFT